ncbi:hypothetical protein AB3Y13_06165 [Vibrio alginolyticus]
MKSYILGKGSHRFGNGSKREHLYCIEYHPENLANPFGVWEGVRERDYGSNISAEQLLTKPFDHFLYDTNSEWLIPLLEKVNNDCDLKPDVVIQAYIAKYGEEPTVITW